MTHGSETSVKRCYTLLTSCVLFPSRKRHGGLTSHFYLCLLAADDYHTPWYVRLIGSFGEYTVDYLMPEAEAPWPYARVTGETRSQDRAVEMIETAMRLSPGWER